jgi:hypothetical protein
MHKITYKKIHFLQFSFVLNKFKTFKILYVHTSLVKYMSLNSLNLLFEINLIDFLWFTHHQAQAQAQDGKQSTLPWLEIRY